MTWFESVREGLKGLAVHKVRTGLSMLGIVFGVASVVAVVAVAEGGKREFGRILEALGATTIRVKAVNFADDHEKREAASKLSRGLTLVEAGHLGRYPSFVAYAPLKHLQPYGVPVNVRSDRHILSSPSVVGTTAQFLGVMSFRLTEGRFLAEEDEPLCRRVCVLEYDTKHELWPTGSAVGEWLYIDNEPYEVVGVLERKHTGEEKYELASEPAGPGGGLSSKGPRERDSKDPGAEGDDEAEPSREERRQSEAESLWKTVVAEYELNRRIYVPLSCALARTTQSKKESEIDEVIFRTRRVEDLPVAKDVILRFLLAAHRMQDVEREDRDFRVEVPLDLIRQKQENQRIFNWVIGATAGISLLVGGIGIMNIMLANLSERRREIGVRRAVGATERDILRQFIAEAVSICVFGGAVGLLLGVGMSFAVSWLAGYETAWAWWGVGAALVVSVADGLAFGTYPAYKAAKLDPIEALRVE